MHSSWTLMSCNRTFAGARDVPEEEATLLTALCGFVGDIAGDGLAAETWRLRRKLAITEKHLSVSVGHVDLLALP